MFDRLHYSWRVLATGFSFAIFAVGGACIGLFIAVYFYLAPMARTKKHKFSRTLVARSFRLYINMMRFFGLLTYSIKGGDRLGRPGQLIIANHPSLLDVVFLMSLMDDANCVVKGSLRSSWLTRWSVIASDYISGDSESLLDDCKKALDEGESLIIFPEGTRTHPGQKPKFLRGAAYIAKHSGCQLTPVLITCDPPTLLKGQKWYQIPAMAPHFSIHALEDIDLGPAVDDDRHLREEVRQLNVDLQDIYALRMGL